MLNKLQVVSIEWRDAKSVEGWCHEKDFELELPKIFTAGYLIKETSDAYFISPAVHPSKEGLLASSTMVVPKSMIISEINYL